MRREINKILLMAIGIISLLSSCVNETDLGGSAESEKAFVKIGAETRALTGDDLDNEIISLRVITFKPGGSVTGNEFFDAARLGADANITLEMMSGTYDFVFIANENNGAELDDLKASVFTGSKNINSLNAVSIPGTLFNQSGVIPMLTEIQNVKVLPGTRGIEENGNVQAVWGVEMNRLGIRIDMILRSKVDLGNQITAINFYNVPTAVPLRGIYSGQTSTVTRSSSEVIETLESGEESAEYIWGRKAARVILPSHVFNPASDAARALKIELVMGSNNPSVTLGFNEPSDYTLPPNTNFVGEGTIGPLLELNMNPLDWTTQEINGDILGRTLNVSSCKKYLIDGATDRIYFNSNQSNVTIETTAAKGNTSTIQNLSTNTIFDRIAGADASNFYYAYNAATGTGTGYVDLKALSGVAGGIYKIYLNAGGLKRELRVGVMSTAIVPITSPTSYVGTFHRWDETDERRISIPTSGNVYSALYGDWVAVVQNEDGKQWIRLDTEAFGSNGGKVNTGVGTVVSGTASSGIPIKFRVGLTGNHPAGSSANVTGSAKPRYGLIYLYYGTNLEKVHPIYVRQGEAADVINSTVRWTPYNLSDPLRGLGGSDITDHSLFTPQAPVVSTTFADYPTHVGYLFRWNTYNSGTSGSNRAFSVQNPSGTITGYPSTTASAWNAANDPCPAGYRHPTGDEFITFAPDESNSIFGLYADGFFDKSTSSGSVSGTYNYQYGIYGRLFYNSTSNAAIFMPIAGNRIGSSGERGFTSSGCYSSSDLIGSNVSDLYFTSSSVVPNDKQFATGRALSVRCVAK